MVVSLYNGPDAVAPAYQSVLPSVSVGESGAFNVVLGTPAAPLDTTLFANTDNIFVGVSVAGEPELPRQSLAAAPYALAAAQLACTGCITPEHTTFLSGCTEGEVLKYTGGEWGCGEDSGFTYTAGDGLALTDKSFALNPTGCEPGYVLQRNESNTAWFCGPQAQGPPGENGEPGTNGEPGDDGEDGLVSLVATAPVEGENLCANGGFHIFSGLDLNKDQVLDLNVEVTDTRTICNGENGPAGPPGEAAGLSYEPWNLNMTLSEFHLSSSTGFFAQFIAPAKSDFSTVTVFTTVSSTATYTGTLHAAIYSNSDPLFVGEPSQLLAQGTVSLTAEDVDMRYHAIEFAEPVTLTAHKRYWVAISANSGSGENLFMGFHNDYAAHHGLVRGKPGATSAGVFPAQLGTSNLDSRPFWFRLH